MAGCGCNVVQASGDPHGKSISALGGIKARARKAPAGKVRCTFEGKKKKTRLVCRDAKGRIVSKTKKPKRGAR